MPEGRQEPSFRLDGKTALVTGSTGGIGLCLARCLAKAGARTLINGRVPDRTRSVADRLVDEGLIAVGVAFDVTNSDAVEETLGPIGPIDILVNNAGVQERAALLDLTDEVWNRVLDVNLTSVLRVSRNVAQGMVERKSGKIINICSLMSEVARPSIAPYAASKGALKQLTRAMCVEWAGANIQVNGIGPGYILTELTQGLAGDPEFDGWVRRRTPAGRWGTPEDLTGAALFLASSASDFVNGQILYVDGGILASL